MRFERRDDMAGAVCLSAPAVVASVAAGTDSAQLIAPNTAFRPSPRVCQSAEHSIRARDPKVGPILHGCTEHERQLLRCVSLPPKNSSARTQSARAVSVAGLSLGSSPGKRRDVSIPLMRARSALRLTVSWGRPTRRWGRADGLPASHRLSERTECERRHNGTACA